MINKEITGMVRWIVAQLTRERSVGALTDRRAVFVLSVSIIFSVFFFYGVCILKYFSFSYRDYDLAYFAQIVWNILNGSIYNSILGIPFLGNHVQLIWFLIAPFYALYPHPLTLVLFQSLALGGAALPLYYLARRFLSVRVSLLVSICYLLYPAVAYLNLVELHSTAFAPLFFFTAFLFFFRDKFFPFLVALSLAVFCQENLSLAGFIFSFYAWRLKKPLKWILVPGIVFGIYLWICVRIIMPGLNSDTSQFGALYQHLGSSPQRILLNIFVSPGTIFQRMFGPYQIQYLIHLFAPLAFLPLVSPVFLLGAFPLFAQHLLSSRLSQVTIYYHYTAELIPFIFLSLVIGLKNLSGCVFVSNIRAWAIRALFLSSILSAVFIGPIRGLLTGDLRNYWVDEYDIQKKKFLDLVDPQGSVVATFEFLPHLTQRKELYSFHHPYSGFYTLSTIPYELPKTVRYALVDFNDGLTFGSFYHRSGYKNIQKFLNSDSWGVLRVRDNVVLFAKGEKSRYRLYNVSLVAPEIKSKRSFAVDSAISFLGYDVRRLGRTDIHFSLYWHAHEKTDDDRGVFFDFTDESGRLIQRVYRPICYRIFPTQAWQPGQFIREEVYLTWPGDLPQGRYRIMMGFYDLLNRVVYGSSQKHDLWRTPLFEAIVTSSEVSLR